MKKLFFIFISFVILLSSSCKKEESGTSPGNNVEENLPPVITNITSNPQIVKSGEQTILKCYAEDPEGDPLSYKWSCPGGTFMTSVYDSEVVWKAGEVQENELFFLTCRVSSEGNDPVSGEEGVLVKPADPEEETTYIECKRDTYVDSENPNSNYGNAYLVETGGNSYGYVGWDLNELNIPTNATITRVNVILKLAFNNSYIKPTGDIYLYGLPGYTAWFEDAITYNSRPIPNTEAISYAHDVVFESGGPQHFDVTTNFKSVYSNYPNGKYSIMVHTLNLSSSSGAEIYAKETGSNYHSILLVGYLE